MLSIVIPVLNEIDTIERLLAHLIATSSTKNLSEIIIVDGGSRDNTVLASKSFAKNSVIHVKVLSSEKGRAKQMNIGAKEATGSILYFLHADSIPPQSFDALIISEVQKGNLAGCFKMKFDSTHWWLRLASWFTHFSWRICRGGDQSQFITKALFEEIGGYDETYTIYEDNILINQLYDRKQFVVIQKWLGTSARLYRERGVFNLQYHFFMIYIKKWLGADAKELSTYYQRNIRKLTPPNDSLVNK